MHWNKERLAAPHERCVYEEGRNGAVGTVLAIEVKERTGVLRKPIELVPRTLKRVSMQLRISLFLSYISKNHYSSTRSSSTPSLVHSKGSFPSLIQLRSFSATSARTTIPRPEAFTTRAQVHSKRSFSSLIQFLLSKNSFSIKEAPKQCVRRIFFRTHARTPLSEELFPAGSSSSVVVCV